MKHFIWLILVGAISMFPPAIQGQVSVLPTVETGACHTGGDVCDDSAIWIHPTDPSQSTVIGDDKNGGIIVWDLVGRELQYIEPTKLMNNLDIRYNFPLTGTFSNGQAHTKVALVVIDNESDGQLNFYKVNPATRLLEPAGTFKTQYAAPYGGCMYHSPVSGKYYFFANWKSGVWQQIELTANGSSISGTSVREADAGGQTEGCVADDVHKVFYIGEEAVGVWRYGAEPGDGSTRMQISGAEQVADTEGMSIYYKSDGSGYLIVSSQGSSNFSVYDRATSASAPKNTLRGQFKMGGSGTIDASSSTDGLDVTNFPLGAGFPTGLFVNHDASNTGGSASNHKFTPFERIATALNLTTDTSWDPRQVGTKPGTTPPSYVTSPPATVTQPATCTTKPLGDADCNGRTDQADFEVWRKERFNELTTKSADFNGDALIDTIDFEIWRRNFFGTSSTPTPTGPQLTPTLTPTGIPPTPTVTGIPPTITNGPTLPPPPPGSGLWISKAEIAALSTTNQAWSTMKSAADGSIGSSALYYQDSNHPQMTLAVALVAAKLGPTGTCGGQNCRDKAAAAILDIMNDGPTTGGGDGRVLALGRNLAGYVIAADLIDLKTFKPADDQRFRTFLKGIQTKSGFPGACGPGLIMCHETRPNNWGTMAGASRIALDLYIGDSADLAKAVATFKGFIGEPGGTDAFAYQPNAARYSCSPKTPMNRPGCTLTPPGCSRSYDMSGADIDDVQRDLDDGVAECPPYTNYAWGGFSGLVAQAELLHRAGYPSYTWSSQAIKRGMNFLQTVMPTSASNPTEWVPHVVNKRYNASFNASGTGGGGRLMDWTAWTHGR